MNNDTLNIHDHDLSTQGGPPGWLAFGVVASSYFVVLLGIVMFCVVVP